MVTAPSPLTPHPSARPTAARALVPTRCRLGLLAVAVGTMLGCDGAGEAESSARPPNLVLVILDTLRADRLGAYGYPADTSPALDAIARKGVRFERVIAQSSWTRPSIGSLLTSRYPRSLGLYTEGDEILDDGFVTLAERLSGHGYRTVGLTANPNINSAYNFHQGFDHYVDSDADFPWRKKSKQRQARSNADLVPASTLFTKALELASEVNPAEPVYLQLNLMDVHAWSRKKAVDKLLRPEYRELFQEHSDPRYLQLTRQLTDDLADFVDSLRQLPGWEDALFSILSDHGEGLSDHPGVEHSRHHGVLLYESQVSVPWILYREGWQPVLREAANEVRLLEVVPTLLALLGLAVPDDVEGRSLRPLIEGKDTALEFPEYWVVETEFRGRERIAVYSDEWEYIDNRSALNGLPARELQRRGKTENGKATDVLGEHTEIGEELKKYLAHWEQRELRRPPTPGERALSDEERQQLEAIGYLEP